MVKKDAAAQDRILEDAIDNDSATPIEPLPDDHVLSKAKTAREVAEKEVSDHFIDVNKRVSLGSGGVREIDDIMLTRYAC